MDMATKKKAVKAAKENPNPHLIRAYKPKISPISLDAEVWARLRKFGGWKEKSKTFVPLEYRGILKSDVTSAHCYALDNIACAMEAGAVDSVEFVKQIFASRDDFEAFCDDLQKTDTYWLNDRHFGATSELVGEEGAVSYVEVGQALEDAYPEEE